MTNSQSEIDAFETTVIAAILGGDRLGARTHLLAWLDDPAVDAPPRDRARVARLLCSPDLVLPGESDIESRLMLRVLEETAAAGDPAWSALAIDNGFDRTQAALIGAEADLLLAEQLAYAPPGTSWHSLGIATLERVGMHDPERSRAAERLLHGLGETSAAYRVERARKRTAQERGQQRPDRVDPPVSIPTGQRIVLAGGHPALRKAVARHIEGRNGRLREIPSKYEAVRRERHIMQLVGSSDLAIIIIRQIDHSTSDGVKRAAMRTGVRWRPAFSPGVAGILEAIDSAADR